MIGRIRRERVVAVGARRNGLDEASEEPDKRVADACALAFSDDAFDHATATAFWFFMYLPRERCAAVVREAYRALRKGGRLHVWDAPVPRRV